MDFGIENLVFSGGGSKGLCFIGCLNILEKYNIIPTIKHIAATSAGSLIALCIILGYKSENLKKIILKLDINYLVDISSDNILNFPINFGIDSGNKIEKIISILIRKKGFLPEITFKQLYNNTRIEFTIIGSCVSKVEPVYFHYKTHPNMSVLKAIRISCSVPLLFNAVKYEGEIYADGCLFNNYPMNVFQEDLEKSIGFFARSPSKYEHKLSNYIMNVYYCVAKTLEKHQIKEYEKNTIHINIEKCGRFITSEDEKKQLIEIGKQKTEEFLNNYPKKIKKIKPPSNAGDDLSQGSFSDLTKEIQEILADVI